MTVNGPNEWSGLRAWLAARIRRPVDFDDAADDRVSRSRAAVRTLDHGPAAPVVEAVRRELEAGGDPRSDDVLRIHLALALAARSVEIREAAPDGTLTVRERRQLTECRALADEILALRPDDELTAFAHDLRDRLDHAERWRWVAPTSVSGFAVVLLAVAVLPFVGGAVGDATVTVAGVLVGGALVFGSVLTHRKQRWEPGP